MSVASEPQGHMLVDQLRFMASVHANEVAYRDLNTATDITFAAWDARSNQMARWLIDHGVDKRDRVSDVRACDDTNEMPALFPVYFVKVGEAHRCRLP